MAITKMIGSDTDIAEGNRFIDWYTRSAIWNITRKSGVYGVKLTRKIGRKL